ncbi:MAG: hypothetical protein QF682_00150 [Candidatus Thermoplasmatota archaeon]|jgi:hypothetical protein|nr:hypothetical protein [Candidatus Thermoplasmatota archaeon]
MIIKTKVISIIGLLVLCGFTLLPFMKSEQIENSEPSTPENSIIDLNPIVETNRSAKKRSQWFIEYADPVKNQGLASSIALNSRDSPYICYGGDGDLWPECKLTYNNGREWVYVNLGY